MTTGFTDIEKEALKGGGNAPSLRQFGELPQPPPDLRPDLAALFNRLVAAAPVFSTRRSFVRYLREVLGIDYSHRTLERWDLAIQYIGGRATFRTAEGLKRVFDDLNAAPITVGGRCAAAGADSRFT